MGRRFPGSAGGGGGGGGDSIGEFNVVKMFETAGSFTWTKPTKIGGSRILVHVWGAGGAGHNARSGSSSAQGWGGGGGGYAMKYIDNSSLGATETITIGAGATTTNGQVAPRVLVAIARHLEAIQVITTLRMKAVMVVVPALIISASAV